MRLLLCSEAHAWLLEEGKRPAAQTAGHVKGVADNHSVHRMDNIETEPNQMRKIGCQKLRPEYGTYIDAEQRSSASSYRVITRLKGRWVDEIFSERFQQKFAEKSDNLMGFKFPDSCWKTGCLACTVKFYLTTQLLGSF